VSRLQLSAADDQVWRLTLDAVRASDSVNPMTIRCGTCQATIARAGYTHLGPLFTSSWTIELDSPNAVTVDGRRLSRGAAIKFHDEGLPLTRQSGRPITHTETHGTIALLALPTHLPGDYPDLLVRCAAHGDAVLDRAEVLSWLRSGERRRKVSVSLPHRSYDLGRHDGGSTIRSSETRRGGKRRATRPGHDGY
jgi:hypothetical protein